MTARVNCVTCTPHHPPHSPRPIFRQSCTCGRVNGEVTQPENYPPVENITATVCIRCLLGCSRCNMNFCNTAQLPTWGVSNSLVHCCTLSLCHLGSETSKYQHRDHLVGYYIAATYLAHLASHLCECVFVCSHHIVFTAVQKSGPFL